MNPPKTINPAVLLQVIKVNLLRRPLWQLATVSDCLDMPREEIEAEIESGKIPWAFNIAATTKTRQETRVLGACIVERAMGPVNGIGATQNMQLPEVLNLVLPARDIRSTELQRIFSCTHQHVYQLANNFRVTRKPESHDGPESCTVFARSSVASFLGERRIL